MKTFTNYLSKLALLFAFILLSLSVFALVKPQILLAAEGDSCPGTVYYPENCVEGSPGSCTSSNTLAVSCVIHDGTCQGYIGNRVCGYLNGQCTVINGSPTNVWIPCGTGGTCGVQCRAGSVCGTGYTSASGCPGIGPNFGCSATQVCCRANSCAGEITPTPNPCTTTCTQVTECRQGTNCSGTRGGACGTDIYGRTKYDCTYNSCTTVCAPTATSVPTSTPTPPATSTPIPPTSTTTPTPLPITMCQNIMAYNIDWLLMTNTQLTQTRAGDQIYYCANGFSTYTSGKFTKARFTINGVLFPETSLVRPPLSFDFCQLYTVPANVYNFNVSAEIYHELGGWVR